MPQHDSTADCDLNADTLRPTAAVTTSVALPAPKLGTCLGDYIIESELARGGMGVIYVARHRVLQRRVAIKTLCTGLDRNGSERERLLAEAEAAAKLDHVGIVPIYEVGESQNEPYLVMKLITGENLAQRLQRGPLSIDDTVQVGIQLAHTVHHAHQRGVIHRDLKPANILLDSEHNNRPMITDFGIAKLVQSIRQRMTSAGEPIGTPHYMPPEQADQTRGPVGPEADVYSLGAVLYAALTGRPPFQAANAVDIVFQLLTKEPVSTKQLNVTVPATLDAIVMKCLEKVPSRRYRSAGELAQDLIHFAHGQPTIARPVNWFGWLLYQLRRHFLLATVSGSVVTLMMMAFLLVAFLYARSQNELTRLQLQLTEQSDVIATERKLFRSQLSRLQQREVGKSEFDAERLADYAKYVSERNPTLATRLAIESVKLSLKESLEVNPFCVEWLITHADKNGAVDTSDDSRTLTSLLERAEESLQSDGQTVEQTPIPWLGLEPSDDNSTSTNPDNTQTTPSLNLPAK